MSTGRSGFVQRRRRRQRRAGRAQQRWLTPALTAPQSQGGEMTVNSAATTSTPGRLRGRSWLKELDFTTDELLYLIQLSADLKAESKSRQERRLHGRRIVLIFEETSTRTRCAFEVAAYDQGAHVTYLG